MRIQSELRKRSIGISASSIRRILRQHRLGPVPRGGPIWSQFSRPQAHGVLATDFSTVDTVALRQLPVIELSTPEAHILGVTDHPYGDFVTQPASSLVADLVDSRRSITLLIQDRDTKFTASFDEVFQSEGLRVIRTPDRSPRANAYAERWVRTVRTECLDLMPILGCGHLERVRCRYGSHYNRQRPYRGIDLEVPTGGVALTPLSHHINCHDVLGDLIHEYYPGGCVANSLQGLPALI